MSFSLVDIILFVYFRLFQSIGVYMYRYRMWTEIVGKTRTRTAVMRTLIVEGVDITI